MLAFLATVALGAPSPRVDCHAVGMSCTSVYLTRDGTVATVAPATLDPAAAAWGTFEDGLNVTGWGILNIKTSAEFTDVDQHFAAGVVEGVLTAHHIHPNYVNNLGFTFHGKPVPAAVTTFMTQQDAWTRAQIKANPNITFWQHVAAVTGQFDGLTAGYARIAATGRVPPVPLFGFQMLNAIGDLFQIIPAVVKSARPHWAGMDRAQTAETLSKMGHCSALIKVTGALEDLYMSHSSWFEYAAMNRIFKFYEFAFKAKSGANRISFSSYPGYLESLDDFYMMDSGLGMVQTSNGVMNNTLLDLITPHSLLAWQRVRVASAMAGTGEEWWKAFETAASGTYVNQYMVVDFNRFEPGKALKPGTLWVVEEIPGLVAGGDQTATLARGYWPSYNVPYYAEVYARSGYPDAFDSPYANPAAPPVDGSVYDGGGSEYTIGAPRSKIFRRDQGKVVDFDSYKQVLRYANYSDPYAIGTDGQVDYGAAICMRGDLGHGGTGGAGGCYDTKVTSYLDGFRNMSCEAVNGPSSTASSPISDLAPFSWRPIVDKNTLHFGLPETFDFPFLRIKADRL